MTAVASPGFWVAASGDYAPAGWDPDWPGQVEGEPGTLEHFERWASQLVFDDGRNHPPEPWQLAFVADLLAGFRENWLLVPEGNSKTTLVAQIALYHLETVGRPWVPVAAASRDQAEILFSQAKGFVEMTPGLKFEKDLNPNGPFEVKGSRLITHRFNDGMGMKVYAADRETADGVIPTLPIIDEAHRHKDLGLYRLWTGKLRKRRGRIVLISTAGVPGTDFEKTRQRLKDAATDRQKRGRCYGRYATETTVLHEYVVPRRDLCEDLRTVAEANPLSTITVRGLREKRQSPTLDYGDGWLRLTCNIAARSSRAAINDLDWDACELRSGEVEDARLGTIPEGVPVTVGADFAWSMDSTALAPVWVPRREFRLLGQLRVLWPPGDGSLLEPLAVREAFRRIHERNSILRVVADKTKAQDTLIWVEDELGAEVIDRAQTNAEAGQDYESFMEGIRGGASPDEDVRERWLRHDGDRGTLVYRDGEWLPENALREHAMNAIARKLPGDRVRFDRPTPSRNQADQDLRVIDALTAASMAHRHAVALFDEEPATPLVAIRRR